MAARICAWRISTRSLPASTKPCCSQPLRIRLTVYRVVPAILAKSSRERGKPINTPLLSSGRSVGPGATGNEPHVLHPLGDKIMVTVQQPPVIPGHQIQHIESDTWVTFHELHQRFTIPGQCQAVFHRLRREGVTGWDSATSWTRSAGLVMLTVASRQIALRKAYCLR
jgi:hypothetical protein